MQTTTSPSLLLESLPASLDVALSSGLVLAERLGDIAGLGSRGRNTRTRTRTRARGPRAKAINSAFRRGATKRQTVLSYLS